MQVNTKSNKSMLMKPVRENIIKGTTKRRLLRELAKFKFRIWDFTTQRVYIFMHSNRSQQVEISQIKAQFSATMEPLCPDNVGVKDTEHYVLLCHLDASSSMISMQYCLPFLVNSLTSQMNY